jgi:hypothetical protein
MVFKPEIYRFGSGAYPAESKKPLTDPLPAREAPSARVFSFTDFGTGFLLKYTYFHKFSRRI